jgi:5-methylcytosine-specific restriction endonuclease McrA
MLFVSVPFDLTSLISYLAMALVATGVFLMLRRYTRNVRRRTRADARRSQMLNDIPSELRFRVYERDNYTCQRCGTKSDIQLDFIDAPPDSEPARMQNLTTRCARCAAIVRQSGIMR